MPAPRRRGSALGRLLPAAPLGLAAAVAAAVMSGTLQVPGAEPPARVQPVSASWQRFAELASGDADAHQVIAAAEELHESLAELITAADSDPDKAQEALRLLRLEQILLLRDQPPGMDVVLAQSRALVAQLRATVQVPLSDLQALTGAVPSAPGDLLPLPSAGGTPSATATPRPSPAATQAPSPSPSASATAKPSSSAPPSPEPTTTDPVGDLRPRPATFFE